MHNSSRKRAANASVFAALGDQNRLRLLARLCHEGPMSISSLTADSGVTRQAISKHLRILENAGLVRGQRCGRESLWRLERRRLENARRYLDLISNQWDQALQRLQRFVEV
jgi:DNA-binding transcriptional ArsR family regulator